MFCSNWINKISGWYGNIKSPLTYNENNVTLEIMLLKFSKSNDFTQIDFLTFIYSIGAFGTITSICLKNTCRNLLPRNQGDEDESFTITSSYTVC